jgi:hypothetical protein
MEGVEMCGKTPSSDNNIDKGRPTSEVNFLGFQEDLKSVVTGDLFLRNTASVPGSQPEVWQITKRYRIF